MKPRKFIATTIREYLNESTNNEIKVLQKKLKDLNNWFCNHTFGKKGHEFWDEKSEETNEIRRKLYQLTGDSYGETKEDKAKKKLNQVV